MVNVQDCTLKYRKCPPPFSVGFWNVSKRFISLKLIEHCVNMQQLKEFHHWNLMSVSAICLARVTGKQLRGSGISDYTEHVPYKQ